MLKVGAPKDQIKHVYVTSGTGKGGRKKFIHPLTDIGHGMAV